MKIELPLENWADQLALVPRQQLVELVSKIADRQFTEAIQFYLHKVGEITFGEIKIIPPAVGAKGRPMVQTETKEDPLEGLIFCGPKMDMADGPMPGNVKNFKTLHLSYFNNTSVLDFLRQFQQNSLLENVNLWLPYTIEDMDEIILPVLSNILPLISSINSIQFENIDEFRMDGNGNRNRGVRKLRNRGFSQLANTLLTKPRILETSYSTIDLSENGINWCCRWLYTPPIDADKPRILCLSRSGFFPRSNMVAPFIDRIKKDFSMASHPHNFFIRFYVDKLLSWKDISLDNGKTKEKLEIKMVKPNAAILWRNVKVLLFSRYPIGSAKKWIEDNEKEVMEWQFYEQQRRIYLDEDLQM